MKRVFLIFAGLLLFVAIVGTFSRDMMKILPRAQSASGEFLASVLPFQGRNPHPLDGKLRLFVNNNKDFDKKYQTTLPLSSHTHLEWSEEPLTLHLRDEHGTRMIWRVKGRKLVCMQGEEFLAPDPYGTLE
ncbi:MAG: hypothetical protein V4710_09475 [Verrucomicrobiota bacterium]